MNTRAYTSKQMGDACEMLIAAEMTLAGVPAMKMPDNWPHYDVIAQPKNGGKPQQISVKSRTYKTGWDTTVYYNITDEFDWLAIVLLPGSNQPTRRIFIVPRAIANARARRDKPTSKTADARYWRLDRVERDLGEFENNFHLSPTGNFSVPSLQPTIVNSSDEESLRKATQLGIAELDSGHSEARDPDVIKVACRRLKDERSTEN